MLCGHLLTLMVVFSTQYLHYGLCDRPIRKFPADFRFGVGSSAYQIEGGWNAHGKGESIWNVLTHRHPEKMPDRSNADVTADSYHQWRRDVQMVRELGVDIYRFSISWTRILPNGFVSHVNKHGIRYYNNLINELLRYNITPMVTIYHWDLPQSIQELGGWTNPAIIDHVADYATILFEQFGDRVKIWTTINEPWHICEQAHGVDFMAPAMNFPGIPSYMCGHNVLKAHAEIVHLYRDRFQSSQKGKIGITTDTSYPQAKTDSNDDKIASELALQFYLGWFAHPIFSKNGDYPQVMIDRVEAHSKQQGFPRSRLPSFTQDEIERIRGTADFFGVNSYTSVLVTRNDRNNSGNFPIPSFNHDMGVVESYDDKWPTSASIWLHTVPSGLYKLLMWINKEYNNPPVIITENGVSDNNGVDDRDRINYFNSYLSAVLDAMEDGCKIQGYIAWSLMDSYEWRAGYTEQFGLYHVDFKTASFKYWGSSLDLNEKTRTPKASAKVYANIVRTHAIDWNYHPEPSVIASRQQYDESKGNASSNDMSVVVAVSSLLMQYLVYSILRH